MPKKVKLITTVFFVFSFFISFYFCIKSQGWLYWQLALLPKK